MNKKRLLLVYPYERIYPPVNGGMQRSFHVIHQFAGRFDVSLMIGQPAEQFLAAGKEFPAIGKIKVIGNPDRPGRQACLIPRRYRDAIRYRWINRSLFAVADSMFLEYYYRLRDHLSQCRYDAVVLNNISLLPLARQIRKWNPGIRVIYDAYNVDSALALEQMHKGLVTERQYRKILRWESGMYRQVDGLMVCSQEDFDAFQTLNNHALQAAVVPNGVMVAESFRDAGVTAESPDRIIFCGSVDYFANVEGMLWFHKNVWPLLRTKFPSLRWTIIGSGSPDPSLEGLQRDASVDFLGRVDDVKEYYGRAAVAVVPLLTGSGTRLKILEAMSLGIPVVSTAKGAEGIAYKAGENILVEDNPISFAAAVAGLIDDKSARIRIRDAARQLIADRYDWNIIGEKGREFLDACLQRYD